MKENLKINGYFHWIIIKFFILNLSEINEILIKIKDNLTSYEITWANPRYDPIREYFEFEAQPLNKIVYLLNLEMQIKK